MVVKHIPFIGFVANKILNCLFLDNSKAQSKADVFKRVQERQKDAVEGLD